MDLELSEFGKRWATKIDNLYSLSFREYRDHVVVNKNKRKTNYPILRLDLTSEFIIEEVSDPTMNFLFAKAAYREIDELTDYKDIFRELLVPAGYGHVKTTPYQIHAERALIKEYTLTIERAFMNKNKVSPINESTFWDNYLLTFRTVEDRHLKMLEIINNNVIIMGDIIPYAEHLVYDLGIDMAEVFLYGIKIVSLHEFKLLTRENLMYEYAVFLMNN